MNQRGFATLEVILMVMVIGILASVAVPRFNEVTTAANTAKIQSDLSTIDTAISLYYMDEGEYPGEVSDLKDYLRDADNIKPPTGTAYVTGKVTKISKTKYEIGETGEGTAKETRATLDGNTAGKFTKSSSSG
ncbi:MAG: type II secretion system protein [Selenomonadaceae bacterium]|nr:type II secretion system protein [Selenomonadaceae bacterium]MBQ3726261.1 type II secretion system protein [Selenomonadaceae bacterium]MBQ9497608.1 type II secretion system protein [Selenomonadaceae bacterium]